MTLEAASSNACSGASAGIPSAEKIQSTPGPCPGPHSAGTAASGCADATTSCTSLSLLPHYFHVKSFEIKVHLTTVSSSCCARRGQGEDRSRSGGGELVVVLRVLWAG